MDKNTPWFSHDSNARGDEKILAMRSVYGKEGGYGWYWILIEMMRDATNYQLQCTGKYWHFAISKELDSGPERTQEFIMDCIHEFNLFETDGQYFWSPRLRTGMKRKDDNSLKAKEAVEKRWRDERERKIHSNNGSNTDVSKNDTEIIHSIVQYSKEEYSTEKDYVEGGAGGEIFFGTPVPHPTKVSVKEKQDEMISRQKAFYRQVADFKDLYSKEMLRAFYDHWTEPNKSRTKMLFEYKTTWDLKRRLNTWDKNRDKFDSSKSKNGLNESQQGPTVAQIRDQHDGQFIPH